MYLMLSILCSFFDRFTGPIGYMQKDTGSSYCNPCLTGEYQNALGGHGCKECPIGYSNDGTKATICNDCPMGLFQNEVKQPSCKPCPAGMYSKESGATSDTVCVPCSKGTYSTTLGADNKNVCFPCAPGKWSDEEGAVQGSDCKACLKNHFSADEGRSETCEKCPPESTTDTIGQTICRKCDAGEHMNTETDGTKSCLKWLVFFLNCFRTYSI